MGLESVGPLLVAVAVDRAVAGSTRGLVPIVAAIGALALVKFAMAFLRRYLGGRLSLLVQHDLRRRVFGSISRLDGPRQDALRTGQVVSRANSDLQQVQGLLGMVPYSVGTLAQVAVSVVIMAFLSPLLTVVALITLPVALVFTTVMRRRLFPATWSAQQRAAEVAQGVEEAVTGVRVVKGFGQEERETARLAGVAARLYGERLRAARLTARLTPTLAALPTIGQLVVFALGGALALYGQISIGVFLAFVTYIAALIAPARMVAAVVVTGQLARAGVERVYELIDSQPDIVDAPDAVAVPDGPVGLALDDVRFGYARSEPVLDGVTLVGAPRRDARGDRHRGLGQVDDRAARAALLRRAGRVADGSAGATCGSSRSPRCAAPSAWCSRRRSSSPTRCAPTSPTAAPTPPTPRSAPPPRPPRPTSSSANSPTATTPASASAASRSPAGSASASPWPAPCSTTPGCCCSTTRRAPSTPPPRPRSARPCAR